MRFAIAQESRIGDRKTNQDRLGYRQSRETLLLVVADGMGGHLHGELAAQVATDVLFEAFGREALPRLSDPFLFLTRCFAEAHDQIARVADMRGLYEVPRTTCVACVIQDGVAYWAHAGDSRLYLVRNGRIQGQTRDHTRVRQLLDQGLITLEMVQDHPERNRLYSCLGGDYPPQVDYSHKTPLFPGDTLALCSDGAWGQVDEAFLVETLSWGQPADSVPRILDEALRQSTGESDNLSLIVLRWEDTANHGSVSESPNDEEIERAIDEIRGIRRS